MATNPFPPSMKHLYLSPFTFFSSHLTETERITTLRPYKSFIPTELERSISSNYQKNTNHIPPHLQSKGPKKSPLHVYKPSIPRSRPSFLSHDHMTCSSPTVPASSLPVLLLLPSIRYVKAERAGDEANHVGESRFL